MRAIVGYLGGAVLLALIGGVCLAAGLLDREIARAQQSLVALNYEESTAGYERVERYFEYGRHLPWIADGPLRDLRARRAALQYWQRQYGDILAEQADPVGNVPADEVERQLVVANAVYRAGQAQSTNRQATLEALDAGILGYLTVLKNAARQEDAAYNYEYLVRLREELLKGRKKPGVTPIEPESPHGRAGAPPEQDSGSEFKIYIPLEADEREKGTDAGKGPPIRRKG